MKNKKNLIVPIIIVVVVLALIVSSIILFGGEKRKKTIEIYKLYDADGNEIPIGNQVTFGGTFGVAFASFIITAYNDDTIPLTFTITDSSPIEFTNALDLTPIVVQSGLEGNWISDPIDVQPFVGGTLDLSITIEASGADRVSASLTEQASYIVSNDPVANFRIQLGSPAFS